MSYVMGILPKKLCTETETLDRPLDAPDQQITKLFGTNFDASVINQDILEELPGALFHFKAKDEGIY